MLLFQIRIHGRQDKTGTKASKLSSSRRLLPSANSSSLTYRTIFATTTYLAAAFILGLRIQVKMQQISPEQGGGILEPQLREFSSRHIFRLENFGSCEQDLKVT
jgi:hypothetical protein